MLDTSQKRFGKTVRNIRIEHGISQEALAEMSNLHRTYISDIELGKRNISLANIERISKALNITLSELFIEFDNIHA